MSDNKSIVDRVKGYIAGSRDIEARGMAELSPMAIAVIDNYDETDIYFDAKSYKLRMEQVWKDSKGKNCLFPPALEGTGLGVLQGIGKFPQVKGYDKALEFAKQQLEPILEESQFYKKPIELE